MNECTKGDNRCVKEETLTCFHCGTLVVEHYDEDGTPVLVEPVQ